MNLSQLLDVAAEVWKKKLVAAADPDVQEATVLSPKEVWYRK